MFARALALLWHFLKVREVDSCKYASLHALVGRCVRGGVRSCTRVHALRMRMRMRMRMRCVCVAYAMHVRMRCVSVRVRARVRAFMCICVRARVVRAVVVYAPGACVACVYVCR